MSVWNEKLNLFDVGDRVVTVSARLARPRLVVIENVLSDDECDAIIFMSGKKLEPSKTVRPEGGQEANPNRTSAGTYFLRGEWPVLDDIDMRIARLTNRPIESTESFQIFRYGLGDRYAPHFDYFDEGASGFQSLGGQRNATMLLYLNTPKLGGATEFPDVGFRVAARAGTAVMFEYPSAVPSGGSLHGGAPVLGGEKWVMTKWFRKEVPA